MVLEKGHGVRETARLLGISRTTLVGCVKEVREHEEADSFPGSGHRHRMDKEIARLRRRGRRVNTTNSRHDYPIAPSLIGSGYIATRPDQVWLSDLTYISTGEGWLYLATVEDLCTRKVVGWSMDRQMTKELTMNALKRTIKRYRPPKGLLQIKKLNNKK